MPRTARRVLLIAAAFALFVVPAAAIAAAGFTDVADDSVFVADIQWMKDNDITRGCNPPANDRFCPGNNVTREQMSAFMHRLAVNQVVDAATAIEADNADTLDGMDAADLSSTGYVVRDEGFVSVSPNSTKTIVGLSLPAGTYLIFARGSINSNMGTAGRQIECTLSAGTSSQTLTNLFLNANGQPGETEEASFMIGHTFAAPGTARLSCQANSSWSGNIIDPTITAISVQDLNLEMLTAAAGGDANSS